MLQGLFLGTTSSFIPLFCESLAGFCGFLPMTGFNIDYLSASLPEIHNTGFFFFYDLTFLVSWNVRSFHFDAKAVARNNAKREHALCCMQLDAQMNQFDWIKVGWQRNHSSMWPKPRLRQDAVDCPLPFTDSCSSLISSLCVFLIAGTRAWLNRFACTTIRVLEQGRQRQRRPRQKTMNLIGWMRKNNRAARAFVQFFDVVWHVTMWNFLVQRQREHTTATLSFSLFIYFNGASTQSICSMLCQQ